MKRILLTSLILFATTLIASSYIYFAGEQSRARVDLCRGIEIRILDSCSGNIISCSDILDFLHESGIAPDGQRCGSIDLQAIEDIVNSRGEILKSDVYNMADGTLRVDVVQRKAAIRLLAEDGRSFYSDYAGFIFPVKSHIDVPLITGNIPLDVESGFQGPVPEENRQWLEGAIRMTTWIENHEYWKNLFSQIDVAPGGDFVLYPMDGRQRFIFGDSGSIEDKFSKIDKYYRCIAPGDTASGYTCINLKFRNQIICK